MMIEETKEETISHQSLGNFDHHRGETESYFQFLVRQLTAKKSIEYMILESDNKEFKRNLNVFHLIFLGIGNVIGTGIYVLSGLVAANNAGPAVIISFIIASVVASLSALCYSELSAMIPVAGSAYAYTYATMGEFIAWMVGWALILEYLIGVAAVAVGWSGYLVQFFNDAFGVQLSPQLVQAFIKWDEASSSFELTGNYFNLPAVLIITFLSILLVIGTRESASITATACAIKLFIIILFVCGAGSSINFDNYTPFIPPAQNDYYGHFGVLGVLKGASIVFFCYAGFDSVSTTSQEAKNPKRDMPIGIIGSLLVCTVLYVVVCFVLVGIAPYYYLNVPQPITLAISLIDKKWLGIAVGASAVIGMLTAMMMGMLGQSRIFYSMSRDGLLPKAFSKMHPRFGTPYISQFIVWLLVTLVAGTMPVDVLGELSGVGTLFAFFLVCLSVMILRLKRPNLHRPFKVPFGPYVIPLLGALTSLALVFASSPSTVIRLGIWLAVGTVIYFLYSRNHSKILYPLPSLKAKKSLSTLEIDQSPCIKAEGFVESIN